MSKKMPAEFYSLLEEIQAIDFVIVELNLYLDTHPDDFEAINQFNENAEKSMKLKIEFEKKLDRHTVALADLEFYIDKED